MYRFKNPDGTEWQFGPSAHLRTWKSDLGGKAHDIWVAENGRCFHSPGPGGYFHEDDLRSVLSGVRWLFVISYATTYEAFREQLARARAILGLPWTLPSSNCQHTISYVTTGTASSFQWEALLGLGAILVVPPLVAAIAEAMSKPAKRRKRRR